MGNRIVLLHMSSYWARHDTPEVSIAKYGSMQAISIVYTWEFAMRVSNGVPNLSPRR
jgi:hypothetical protein